MPARRRATTFLLLCFSVFYFADICLRASGKYFWFDELVTVYLCRLPSIGATYRAALLGADYNPPLFHILTRLAEGVFGEGLVATRLPSIAGVWVLCLCLFAMVSKRSGAAAGCAAMLLPLLTSARFYAYEARATGIVLGLAGLAALAWQRLPDGTLRRAWLGLFGASLLAAFLTHCYAITLLFPFACGELFRAWRKRRMDRAVWAVMAGAAVVALAFYVPLFRSFERHVGGQFFPPSLGSLQSFYSTLLWPAMLPLVGCVAVFAVDGAVRREGATGLVPGSDVALALGFLVLPATGLALAFVIHGPFIGRYLLSAVLGVCLAIGYAAGRAKWMAVSLAIFFALLISGDFARLVRHRLAGVGETLAEPNTQLPMNTTPGQPLRAYDPLWGKTPGDAPIVVTDGLEFAFLSHYAPLEVRSRLFYLREAGDTVGGVLEALRAGCQVSYQFADPLSFARATPHFFVYGKSGQPLAELLQSAPSHTAFRGFSGDRVVLEVMRGAGD